MTHSCNVQAFFKAMSRQVLKEVTKVALIRVVFTPPTTHVAMCSQILTSYAV